MSAAAIEQAAGRDIPVQRYARLVAFLMLLSIVFGGLGEGYIPAKLIVWSDAARTVANLTSDRLLYRIGFATYLVEAFCDVALALLFYILLRPVARSLAFFTLLLGLVSTITFAIAQAFHLAPSVLLSNADYLKAFTSEQINALTMVALRLSSRIAGLFLCFYGTAMVIRGYLIYRSGYVPRTIGVLLAIGGAGFVAQTLATVLAPQYVTPVLLMPMGVAGIALMIWMFVKGVDVEKWRVAQRAAT